MKHLGLQGRVLREAEIPRLRAAVKNSRDPANVRMGDFHAAVAPHWGMTTRNDKKWVRRCD
jgi:hypothetical protein